MNNYDVAIIGAGPGGIYSAYKLVKNSNNIKIAIFEVGNELDKRKCPSTKINQCIKCDICAIMSGFGGAGAFSDGKYNITTDFGGTLHERIGEEETIKLIKEVESINLQYNEEQTFLYSTKDSKLKKICMQNGLQLLDNSVRHFGTDQNYIILKKLYNELHDKVDFYFNTKVESIRTSNSTYIIQTKDKSYTASSCILSVGRSGSKWLEKVCSDLNIKTTSNKVDIGVRVELPSVIFEDITNELYEGKIRYKTKKFEDNIRTFCMNPHGNVVTENVDGIITVNGHSFEDKTYHTDKTNFALLVSKHFTEPFNASNEYGQSIAKLSNMLGGGVIVQRFGDLIRGRRTNVKRLSTNAFKPTLNATPGDLSLVLPKRILDDIIEMIYALDKIAPGTANDSTLLYGVEVKFYNMEVDVNSNLETQHQGLYIIGDGSGITHSLSHAAASGIFVANDILRRLKG